MPRIERTYPADGRVDVEPLSTLLFTLEEGAHTFVITNEAQDAWTGVTAYFLRADGVGIRITDGTIERYSEITVTLPEDCYDVPGRFIFSIYADCEDTGSRPCVYACTGSVYRTTGNSTIPSGTSPAATIEEQLRALQRELLNYSAMAAFARNVGEIEGTVDTFQRTVDGINEALAENNVLVIQPNMLDKNAWWTNLGDGRGNVIYGNASQVGGPGAYMKSISANRTEIFDTEPTAEQTAGAYRIYHRTAGQDSSGQTWTEAWIVSWVVDDGVGTQCIDLTGDNIVTDSDGESYNKAIQYSITGNTAWGNAETLYYPQGARDLYYKQGESFKSHGYLVDMMEVGETYTISCWARLTSGTEAWLRFGWGGVGMNGLGYGESEGKAGKSDVYKVTGTEWTRISWTFRFAPTGNEYTETTETVGEGASAYTRIKRSFNWNKRVLIGVHRKYTATLQLCGFRLTHGGLYGSETVETLKEDLRSLTARVAALEAQITPQAASLSMSAPQTVEPVEPTTGSEEATE